MVNNSMLKKVTDDNYESIVYISHPYGGLKENEDKVAQIIRDMHKEHPNYLFVSPIHAFSMMYGQVEYDIGIQYCLWLLEKCDEMWVFGDYPNSIGCSMEIVYCEENGIRWNRVKHWTDAKRGEEKEK